MEPHAQFFEFQHPSNGKGAKITMNRLWPVPSCQTHGLQPHGKVSCVLILVQHHSRPTEFQYLPRTLASTPFSPRAYGRVSPPAAPGLGPGNLLPSLIRVELLRVAPGQDLECGVGVALEVDRGLRMLVREPVRRHKVSHKNAADLIANDLAGADLCRRSPVARTPAKTALARPAQRPCASRRPAGSRQVVRFLIDECLTVELAREAEKAGFEAYHVAHLGKTSSKDWTIRDHAIKGDFVLVTNNASDFRMLYAAQDLHPGLVILVPNVVQKKQVLLFRAALQARRTGRRD